MKIGYPCINLSLDCRSSSSFRLKNYSTERVIQTITQNLKCLRQILEFNKTNNILFFRITSDLIPFASHPVMNFEWQDYFKEDFKTIGKFIRAQKMRISMHPGQYTVLNSKTPEIVERSMEELLYHVEVLDLLGLDSSAKVMTHVGGVYGEKKKSIERFIRNYKELDDRIINRYVIENDDKSYSLIDCLKIHERTDIPLILDVYHYECFNNGTSLIQAIEMAYKTWRLKDGIPILHYSSDSLDKRKPNHASSIDIPHFKLFLESSKNFDFDLMLEIKNKEQSVLQAINLLEKDPRFLSVLTD
jgi:UV DNA damage endonuclease